MFGHITGSRRKLPREEVAVCLRLVGPECCETAVCVSFSCSCQLGLLSLRSDGP